MNGNLKRIQSQINLFARDVPSDLAGAISWISVYADFVKALREEMSNLSVDEIIARVLSKDEAMKQMILVASAADALALHAKKLIVLHRGELNLKHDLRSWGFDAPKLHADSYEFMVAACNTNLTKLNELYESADKERTMILEVSSAVFSHLKLKNIIGAANETEAAPK